MWKSVCSKKTYPSILLRSCEYYNPHVPSSCCQSNLTLCLVNFKWRCFLTIRRASKPKSPLSMTLTLGDGSHSSCFSAVRLRTKTWTGYITVGDTKAMEIHFFLAAGNIKPCSSDMSIIINVETLFLAGKLRAESEWQLNTADLAFAKYSSDGGCPQFSL